MLCMLSASTLWLQELAVDLLFYYPTIHEATARTCAVVCLTDTFPVQLALRIIDVLSSRTCQGDGSVLVSFLVTLLVGHVSQAQLLVNHARHAHLVEAVCRAICRLASPGGCSCGVETLWLEAPRVYCNVVVQFAARRCDVSVCLHASTRCTCAEHLNLCVQHCFTILQIHHAYCLYGV